MLARLVALGVGLGMTAPGAPVSCEALRGLVSGDARVTAVGEVKAGAFRPPNLKPDSPDVGLYEKLPAFCRVQATARPSDDSEIAIEIWLPRAGTWNGKLRGSGNGGYAGAIDYRGMAGSVSNGYAGAATDAGHKGEATDASWALGHPEKVIDFGYRAVHEMTATAKAIAEQFYGSAPRRAYFDACSDGGREALMEAQRYPADYDGILAGAPANDWTHLLAAGLEIAQVGDASRANFVPPEKLGLITGAVLKACDATDGVRDGILNNPSTCRFDAATLLCRAGEAKDACLTGPQVATVKKVYAGGTAAMGQVFFPGLMPSSEAGENGWKPWVTGAQFQEADGLKYMTGFFRNMVYEDPHWDWRGAPVASALEKANRKLGAVLNATDPDLSQFATRGGKLILYHGWIDPAIAPLSTVRYYQSVEEKMGRTEAEKFVRLYMAPGMQHCAGGPGPYVFGELGMARSKDASMNVFTALEQWVERDVAPEAVIATKFKGDKRSAGIEMTRPLCPYPQVAMYRGSGDSNAAENFVCREEK